MTDAGKEGLAGPCDLQRDERSEGSDESDEGDDNPAGQVENPHV